MLGICIFAAAKSTLVSPTETRTDVLGRTTQIDQHIWLIAYTVSFCPFNFFVLSSVRMAKYAMLYSSMVWRDARDVLRDRTYYHFTDRFPIQKRVFLTGSYLAHLTLCGTLIDTCTNQRSEWYPMIRSKDGTGVYAGQNSHLMSTIGRINSGTCWVSTIKLDCKKEHFAHMRRQSDNTYMDAGMPTKWTVSSHSFWYSSWCSAPCSSSLLMVSGTSYSSFEHIIQGPSSWLCRGLFFLNQVISLVLYSWIFSSYIEIGAAQSFVCKGSSHLKRFKTRPVRAIAIGCQHSIRWCYICA